MPQADDAYWMRLCLEEARRAPDHGDIPVAALLVRDGQLIAIAHNRREADQSLCAHAELLALEAGAKVLGRWRLDGCSLYVSLEPCAMCLGAILQAQISELIIAANEPKMGACGSQVNLLASPLNVHTQIRRGLLSDESAALLRDFFRSRRSASRQQKRQHREAMEAAVATALQQHRSTEPKKE